MPAPLTLDLNLLRTFVTVCGCRSLSAASAQIGRTHSAVSMQLQRLEQQLDRRFFYRHGRGVELTAEGARLLELARKLLLEHDAMVSGLMSHRTGGVLRLGCPEDYAPLFLPSALTAFAKAYGDIAIEIICEPTTALRNHLRTGRLDLAVVTSESTIHPSLVLREPLVWIAAPDSAAPRLDPLPLAFPPAEAGFDIRLATAALSLAGRAYRLEYVSASNAAFVSIVRAALAVSVMPRFAVPHGLVELGAACGLPPLPEVGIAVETTAAASPAVLSMRTFIAEALTDAAARGRIGR